MSGSIGNAPGEINIKFDGVPIELETSVRNMISKVVSLAGQKMNLVCLDGVTFSHNYDQALLNLDRGYDTKFKLTPSNDHGLGIAMSPSVLRNGKLKTHILLNAQMFFSLLENEQENIIINTIAHECAHVELNHLYDNAFPGTLLRSKMNVLDHFRTESMLTCWNEFGACWRSALFGPTNPLYYEAAFIPALEETRTEANAAIKDYRTRGDVPIVVNKVCGLYAGLLKYSAYHLGNLHGHGLDWRNVATTAEPLRDHWFLPFFERLDTACKEVGDNLGVWTDSTPFDAIRDIAEDVVRDGGLFFRRHDDGEIGLDIPFSIDTMPVPPHLWR